MSLKLMSYIRVIKEADPWTILIFWFKYGILLFCVNENTFLMFSLIIFGPYKVKTTQNYQRRWTSMMLKVH